MFKLNIDDLYGDKDFVIFCPNCLQIVLIKLRDVLDLGNTIVCPECNSLIDVGKDDSVKIIINEINNFLKNK